MNNLNEVLGKMTEFLKTEAKTETIIGEQFKLGEYTCVPIMHIGLGFGGGGGEGKGTAKDKAEGQGFGAGAAAGMGMGPWDSLSRETMKSSLYRHIPQRVSVAAFGETS